MGIMDKIKSLFKKKDAAPKAKCNCGCEGKKKVGSYASQFSGTDAVSKALIHAAEKIDAKIESNQMSETAANIFMESLKGIQASADPEDVKLVQISQVIGGIINA